LPRLAEPRISRTHVGRVSISAFPAELSAHAAQKLSTLGVEVRTGRHVEDVTADGVVVAGAHFPARTVI